VPLEAAGGGALGGAELAGGAEAEEGGGAASWAQARCGTAIDAANGAVVAKTAVHWKRRRRSIVGRAFYHFLAGS